MTAPDAGRPSIAGWSHVALSVTDLDRAEAWYERVLGTRRLFAFDADGFSRRLVVHDSGVVLALTRHTATADDDAFDPRRVGVDHLSFRAGGVDELAAWARWLDGLGVAHGGVQQVPALGAALVACHDPDGIQVELYVQVAAPTA